MREHGVLKRVLGIYDPGAVHSESLNIRWLVVTETAHWDRKLASLPEM
jgi:hypothetical protein